MPADFSGPRDRMAARATRRGHPGAHPGIHRALTLLLVVCVIAVIVIFSGFRPHEQLSRALGRGPTTSAPAAPGPAPQK